MLIPVHPLVAVIPISKLNCVKVCIWMTMAVVSAIVEGPYSELPAHYAEVLAWATWENITITGQPREIYLVHPAADGSGDPATFRTEIQFPIAGE